MAKIIGNTTATPTPVADWNQTDENKADYIKNKPVYIQPNEPVDAPVGALWVDISDLILEYTITNNLINCATSNDATTVARGASYTATISCTTEYKLNTIQVSMDGKDITSSAWTINGSRQGVVSIDSVTGHVVVYAMADN